MSEHRPHRPDRRNHPSRPGGGGGGGGPAGEDGGAAAAVTDRLAIASGRLSDLFSKRPCVDCKRRQNEKKKTTFIIYKLTTRKHSTIKLELGNGQIFNNENKK